LEGNGRAPRATNFRHGLRLYARRHGQETKEESAEL